MESRPDGFSEILAYNHRALREVYLNSSTGYFGPVGDLHFIGLFGL